MWENSRVFFLLEGGRRRSCGKLTTLAELNLFSELALRLRRFPVMEAPAMEALFPLPLSPFLLLHASLFLSLFFSYLFLRSCQSAL